MTENTVTMAASVLYMYDVILIFSDFYHLSL